LRGGFLQSNILKSISDFVIAIAIVIAIKNHSGKIDQRFPDQKRIAVSRSKWVCPVRHLDNSSTLN